MKKRTKLIIAIILGLAALGYIVDKAGLSEAPAQETAEITDKMKEDAADKIAREIMRNHIASDPVAKLEIRDNIVPGPEFQEYIVSGKIKTQNEYGREILIPWHVDMKLQFSDKMETLEGWDILDYGITQ